MVKRENENWKVFAKTNGTVGMQRLKFILQPIRLMKTRDNFELKCHYA